MTVSGYLLFFLPKIASSGSALGSCMIISQVLMSEKNRSNKQQRIVCAMSFIDVLVSSVWFFTNLFIPSFVEEFQWTTGNEASCTAQGFIVQFSISSVIYNAALSYYYVLIIKHNYRDPQLEKIEKWFHLIPLMYGISTAVVAFCLRVYNFATWDCWIAPPYGEVEGSAVVLPRILQWCFFFGPLWIAITFSTINMIRIYAKVKQVELECANSNISRERQRLNVQNTKSVATQGRLYVAAFIVTWIFPTISRVIQLCGGTVPLWLVVCSGTFIPSQGIFNALVYFRLRFKRCSEQYNTRSKLWVVRRIILLTLCPCWQSERYNMNDGRDVEPSFRPSASVEEALSASSRSSNSLSRASSGQGWNGRLSEGWSGLSYPSKNSDPSFVVSETSLTEQDEFDSSNYMETPAEPRRYYQRSRIILNSKVNSNATVPNADVHDQDHDPDTFQETNSDLEEQIQNTIVNERDTHEFLIRSFMTDLGTIQEGSTASAADEEIESLASQTSKTSLA